MKLSSARKTALLLGLALGLSGLADPGVARAADPTAAELSDQAYERYEASDFPGAVALYMKAYALNVDSRILFNVAQIYDRKVQDRDLALEYYRRYLKSTTTEVDLVRKATERVTELQRQSDDKPKGDVPASSGTAVSGPVATPTATSAAATAAPTSEPAPSRPYWIGYGATGLLVVGAAITGGLALGASGDLAKMSYAGSTIPDDVQSASSKVKTLGVVTDVLIGGAVVAAAVTLIVQLASPKAPAVARAKTAPRATAGGAVWSF